jgi:hypothetical protein
LEGSGSGGQVCDLRKFGQESKLQHVGLEWRDSVQLSRRRKYAKKAAWREAIHSRQIGLQIRKGYWESCCVCLEKGLMPVLSAIPGKLVELLRSFDVVSCLCLL